MIPFDNVSLFKIFWVLVISFFSSFAKELNDKAKNPKEGLLLFISETLLNGISGAICGTLVFNFYDNVFLASAISSICGILGVDVLKYLFKLFIVYFSSIKKIDLSEIKNINFDKEENNNKHKKKKKR